MAFIVVTFGGSRGGVRLASIAAASALVLVAVAGVLLRAPLSRVPENTLKFGVGVMLTSFGIFWSTEGAGAHWPGADASLLGVLAFVIVVSLLLVQLLKREKLEAATA